MDEVILEKKIKEEARGIRTRTLKHYYERVIPLGQVDFSCYSQGNVSVIRK